jgi:hypothetical protein
MIGTTSSGILYQIRNIDFISKCCWNVVTYKCKANNKEILIPLFSTGFAPSTKH